MTTPQPQFPLTFLTESLPGFRVGVPQHFQIEVDGGVPPYHFEITEGSLPAALAMGADGMISGKAVRWVPDATIFVRLTDAASGHLTQAFNVEVVSP